MFKSKLKIESKNTHFDFMNGAILFFWCHLLHSLSHLHQKNTKPVALVRSYCNDKQEPRNKITYVKHRIFDIILLPTQYGYNLPCYQQIDLKAQHRALFHLIVPSSNSSISSSKLRKTVAIIAFVKY